MCGAERGPGLAQAVAEARATSSFELVDRLADGRRLDVDVPRQPRKSGISVRGQVDVGHQSTIATSTDEIAGR